MFQRKYSINFLSKLGVILNGVKNPVESTGSFASLRMTAIFFIFLFSFFYSSFLKAEENRIGLSAYEIISPDNQEYLRKVVQNSLFSTLKEKNSTSTIVDLHSQGVTQEKKIPQVLNREKLSTLIVGSLMKVGNRFEIRSDIYFAGSDQLAVSLTENVENPDRLLPALKFHAERITTQIENFNRKTLNSSKIQAGTEKAEVPLKEEIIRANPNNSTEISPSIKTPKKPETDILRDYEWMSERLSYDGKGMVYADLNQDGKPELVVVSLGAVYVYEFSPEKKLKLLGMYRGEELDNFIRVYAIDLNGDQKPEIVVSNIRKGQAASLVLDYQGGHLTPLVKNSPWILKVLPTKEGNILLGEPFAGREVDVHPIKKLKLVKDKLVEEESFEVPRGVGIYGMKEFYFEGQESPGLIYLTPSGALKVYRRENSQFKKETTSSEKYGGTANFIRIERKNILNEVEDQFTYINLDPVTWVDQNGKGAVIVAKNDSFLKNIVGTRPLVKSTSFSKLRWEQIGLRETWNTRKIEGYLVDYQIVKLPWENSPKLLALLWLRDQGFTSSMTGKFPSVVAVYDLE